MHYVIIGAGAVGGTIGGLLHRHGHRVTLVARGDHYRAIRERGLRLATADGDQVLDVPVVTGPAELAPEPDWVLVLTVKSQDSAAALAAWAEVPVPGGGAAGDELPVVCAQNGVASERIALRRFAQVYGACVWLPATFLEPGVVLAEGHPYPGMLHLGRFPAGVDETVERVAADLAASGFLAPVRPDVMRWKYGKLLANLGNGLDALFGSRDDDLYGSLRAEGVAALVAAGVPYTSREEEAAVRGDRVQIRPVPGYERGRSSTWQSLVRATGSVEVDYLNGEVVLLGREHGVPTPVNRAVQRAVHEAVRAGTAAGGFPAERLHAAIAAHTTSTA